MIRLAEGQRGGRKSSAAGQKLRTIWQRKNCSSSHYINTQLAEDRGAVADPTLLCRLRAVGVRVKIRLSSHGYTFVVKSIEKKSLESFKHKYNICNQLRPT